MYSSANLSGKEKGDYKKALQTLWTKRQFTLEHRAGKIKS